MNVKIIFLVLLFLLPLSIFSQDGQYIETKGIIKNIEIKRSGKRVKEIATVSFVTKEGETIETWVELERIPFLGSFKSIGDEITINYKKDNPAIAKTNVGTFFAKYGMYILIFLGIIFSVSSIRNKRKKAI